MTSSLQGSRFSSRRRFLQQTLSGVAGWALWHGWPARHRALAQKGVSTGQMTWAMHITLAPTWFDPAETGALQTPYLCLRALHDALVGGVSQVWMPWERCCQKSKQFHIRSTPVKYPHSGNPAHDGASQSTPLCWPPSTTTFVPLIQLAAGLATNTTARATSSGRP